MKDVPERPKSRESQKSMSKSELQRHIEYMEKEEKNKKNLESEDVKKLKSICDDAINQIQHTDVRPMIDRASKEGDYRPDKVNRDIYVIKGFLGKIKDNADKFDCFSASLRPRFLEVLQFLIKSVNPLRDQAVKDYGKVIFGKGKRKEGSQALMVVTSRFEGMWNLDGLHRIDQSQPKLEEAANSVSPDGGLGPHVQAFRTRFMATATKHCDQLLVSYHDQTYTRVPEEGSFKIACEMLQEQPGDLIEACDQEINRLTSKLRRDYKECEKRVDNVSKKGMKDSISIDNIAGKLNDLRKLINNIEQDLEGPLYQKLKKVREGYQHCLDLQSELSILENPKMAFAYWNEADLQNS